MVINDTEYDRAKVPPYNGNDPPPTPGSLKALLNKVQDKGTQGAQVQQIAKGAGKKVPRENCRKVSKNFLTLFDVFCPARKVSKSVEKLFDTF